MKKALALLVVVVSTVTSVSAQGGSNLPAGAVVIEKKSLVAAGRKRELVLWMLDPHKSDPAFDPEEAYTCPDATRGDAYSGPTRVSLADAATGRIINTIRVTDVHFPDKDSFDIPFYIRKEYYYFVRKVDGHGGGRPEIMHLKDYNGDGKPLEFALFDAVNCMTLSTTLVGYSARQDKVIQYPIELTVHDGTKVSQTRSYWEDHLFDEKTVRQGRWKYSLDYRGRGGMILQYNVGYDKNLEKFVGTCDMKP